MSGCIDCNESVITAKGPVCSINQMKIRKCFLIHPDCPFGKVVSYPKIMKIKNYNIYVSFSEERIGTVILSDSIKYPKGYKNSAWNMKYFEDTDKKIII